jgi:hypothetical protein
LRLSTSLPQIINTIKGSGFIFTFEYLLRLWSCIADPRYTHPIWGRIRFALTPLALIDLIAILPFYLPLLLPIDLRFIRAFRLFRLLRVLKFSRYTESIGVLGNVVRSKTEELFICILRVRFCLSYSPPSCILSRTKLNLTPFPAFQARCGGALPP